MPDVRAPLVDRFGRRHNYLRISVTDRCNFRCAYCMPNEEMEWSPKEDILTFEEILRLSQIFVSLGVDKIRLTGGEPTIRRGLTELVAGLGALDGVKDLLLTTNGASLATMASDLRTAGLTGVNISLDTLKADRFLAVTKRDRLKHVLDGIDAAFSAGIPKVKINVVAMAGVNEDELVDFVDRFRDRDMEVRFIEFMPFLANDWNRNKLLPYAEMRRIIESSFELEPMETEVSAVAKEFRVKGAKVRVGFITSMTEDFCGGCNRLRLNADGSIKVCLFAPSGVSLRDAIRNGASDDDVAEMIRTALFGKWAGHPPMDRLIAVNDRPMIAIGG